MGKAIRKGDVVRVISGNDKGKAGVVLAFRGNDRVIVEGVNVRTKHMKKSKEFPKGKVIDIECPIHISNVCLMINDNKAKLQVRFNNGQKELWNKQPDGSVVFYRLVKERRS